jgi:hypothetical protein
VIDGHEVRQLLDALGKSAAVTETQARAIVARGALNIKNDARRRISGHPTLRRLPYAIDYDVYTTLTGPAAEIGPNHSKPQGNLGHIPEYGTPTSAPMPYMAPAGLAEEPKFAKAIEDAMVKALGL